MKQGDKGDKEEEGENEAARELSSSDGDIISSEEEALLEIRPTEEEYRQGKIIRP